MSDYNAPAGNSVNFTFTGGYSAPDGDAVNFTFGEVAVVTIHSVSRSTIYDDALFPGFDEFGFMWYVDRDGPYQIELGGTGYGTGEPLASGNAVGNVIYEHTFTDDQLEAASGFTGAGSYTFSVYVKSEDNIWNSQG